MKRAVLVFDLDDTLIPSSKIYEATEKEVFGELTSEFSMARLSVKTRLPKLHVSARNRMLYIKEMKDANPNKCLESYFYYMSAYEASLKKNVEISTLSLELSSFLERLSDSYYLCILTNENLRTQLIKIDAISGNIGRFIDKILTSEEVGVEKPDLRIFHELARSFPSETGLRFFMVGDNVAADVIPALNLGWKAAQMTQFIEDLTPHKGAKVSSFDQLLDWLGSM